MINVAFLVRSLDRGGAERQLVTLARALDKEVFDVTVLCFYPGGSLEADLSGSGVRIVHLEKRGRWDVIRFFRRLMRQLKLIRPDVLYGCLGVPNVLTVFLKPFFPATKMVWGVWASYIDWSRYGWMETVTFRLECALSRFADLIIPNSDAGRSYHQLHGFPGGKMQTIRSGFDTELFVPDRAAGAKVREEWGVSKDTILIGLVGRLDPMKDHATFLRAASLLCRTRSDVLFVCVGGGDEGYARGLRALADELGIAEKVIWAGERTDMAAVHNALDIATSSSYGEGLPNVIGEAMACGVPCVVTDVGDSAWVVGETGVVVPPRHAEALAEGWARCLRENTGELGLKARARIVEHCSVRLMTERTEKAITSIL